MKRFIFSALISVILGSQLFASQAVVVCRTSGIMHDSTDAVSMNCGNSTSDCEDRFKEALKSQYGTYDVYDAEKKICNQLSGNWYPDTIRIRY